MPAIMEAYRAGRTPWFVVIAPDGRVVYVGFRLDAEGLIQALRSRSNSHAGDLRSWQANRLKYR